MSLLILLIKNLLFCSCPEGYVGEQCKTQLIEKYKSSDYNNKHGSNGLWVIFSIIVLLIIITATTYYFTKLRRR